MRLVRAVPAPLPHLPPDRPARRPRRAGASPRCARSRRATATVDASFTRMMDECLACRACEAACPSGVPFGRMIEAARAQTEPTRTARARGHPPPGPDRRAAAPRGWCWRAGWAPGRWRGRCASTGWRRRRSGPRRRRRAWRELRTPIPDALGVGPGGEGALGLRDGRRLPARPSARPCGSWPTPATGRCARRPARCCGALAMHYGQPEAARAMARARIAELEGAELVVVNASGCSAHVQDLRRAAGRRPGVGRARRRGSRRGPAT